MPTSVFLDWMGDQGEKLSNCDHENPFSVLGPQHLKDKWVIRVWMPEADKVNLLLNGQNIPLTNQNHPWIFETLLKFESKRSSSNF